MVITRSVRGMNDLFEADLAIWRKMENTLTEIFQTFGYQEIRTPILEDVNLFKRSIGETSDIVEKEMFLVEDGDHTYCLRPENTAPVVRALIERGGISEDIQEKLYYLGPMFRKERPQKGRLRQFHQFGVELFGVSEPSADVEILVMVEHLFKALGLKGITLKINTLGKGDERTSYKSRLREFLSNHVDQLCEDCKRRIVINPLRALDCKNQRCGEIVMAAPKIIDALGKESRMHFDHVIQGLERQGVCFELDHHLVRGLDYYNRTVFEFVADFGLGAQNAVVAGGRYDGLFLTLGSKVDLPGIGIAGGLERMVLLLKEQASLESSKTAVQISLLGADDAGHQLAMDVALSLRKAGVRADFSLIKKSIKAQMRRADKLGAQFVAVLGEQEIYNKKVTIKGLLDKTEKTVDLDSVAIANYVNNAIV